jgi:hypothetical protein
MASVLEYINKLESAYETRLRRAMSSKEDKRYSQVLSELTSFVSSVRNFLNKASVLDNVLRELKVGRVCYKWFYSEDGSHIVLLRLDQHISLFYDGLTLGAAYSKSHYIVINDRTVKLRINNFTDEVSLDNADEVISKRSLIIKTLSSLSNALSRYADEFPICAKHLQQKT